MYIAQLPTPAPGSIEGWLIPAAAVLSLVALGKKVFATKKANGTSGGGPADAPGGASQFATKSELNHELTAVRDKIDARFLTVAEKIEVLGNSISDRLSKLEAAVARVDERTKK
jgi:hypothetical protein